MIYNLLIIVLAIVLAYITGKLFLKLVGKYNLKQPIYEDAPESHQKKAGTPTLGAVVFLIPYIVISFILMFTLDVNGIYRVLMFIAPIGFLSVGISDDLGKIRYNSNTKGLSPKEKMFLQLAITIIIIVFLMFLDIDTTIDFILFEVDFSYFYYIIIGLMFIGFSNAANLTDGLDGLLSSVSIIIFTGILIVAYQLGFTELIPYLIAIISGLAVFLVAFNRYPAKMFMGDTGSLTIGGLYVLFIVLLKVEFIGALFATVYLIEVISVMTQTSYFKYTKKKYGEGRRIFKMAPLHHHFEKTGYSENMVVALFCIIQLIATIIFVILGTL